MYALQKTIKCFGSRIRELEELLKQVTPDADGLKQFLLIHYKFESLAKKQPTLADLDDLEAWDEDYEEEEEDSDQENNPSQQQKRQQLRKSIDIAVGYEIFTQGWNRLALLPTTAKHGLVRT